MDENRLAALGAVTGVATPESIARLAARFGPEAARWAVEQAELRIRARAKFPDAAPMLFVREALEQATHASVAEAHARRFPAGVLVADLTTGIGADLMALARRGPVRGYELEEERAAVARHNLALVGTGEVVTGDSLDAEWDFEYAFADPARRVGGRRTVDPDAFQPDPQELARRMADLRLGGIKLSPMLDDAFLAGLGPEVEFVSFGGECREAVVWTGREAASGVWALHVESGERLPEVDPPPAAEEPGDFLYDADPAAVRAHALGNFGLASVGDSPGYLTGDLLLVSPWLRAYRVLSNGKGDLKTTRRVLRDLGAATPELKQRGAKQDLVALRKALRSDGSRPVSVVVWISGRSLRHTVVEAVGTSGV